MGNSSGCKQPVEKSLDENKFVINQDERVIITRIQNKKCTFRQKFEEKDNEVSIASRGTMCYQDLSEDSVGKSSHQLSDHSTTQCIGDHMEESNDVNPSADETYLGTTGWSLSTRIMSSPRSPLLFQDTHSGDSSINSLSSSTLGHLMDSYSALNLSDTTMSVDDPLELPMQDKQEHSFISNSMKRQGERCRRSIRVSDSFTLPICEVNTTTCELKPISWSQEIKMCLHTSKPWIQPQKFLDTFMRILHENPVCFSTLETLKFDVFRVKTLPKPFNDMPLVTTTVATLYRLNTIEHLKISWLPVVMFLINVEEAYNDHPYHSKWHGADVVGNMAYFINKGWLKRSLSPVHHLIGLLAAASHDVGHNAQTNVFHRLAKTSIGTSWATSNLEHYHIAKAKQILNLPGCNWTTKLKNWDEAWTPEKVWKLFSNLILRTDPTLHDAVKRKPFATLAEISERELNRSHEYILGEILHMADISNAVKPLRIAKNWAFRFYEEFYNLGKEVRRLQLDMPTFQDPANMPTLPDTQLFFISKVCLPSFQDLLIFMPEVKDTVDNLLKNLEYWKSEKQCFQQRKKFLKKSQWDAYDNNKVLSPTDSLVTSFITDSDLQSPHFRKILRGEMTPVSTT